MGIGDQLGVVIKKGRPHPSSLHEGEMTISAIGNKLYLYTNHGGVLYRSPMDRDKAETRSTPLERVRKDIRFGPGENRPKQLIDIYGSVALDSTSRFYRTTGGLSTDWSGYDSDMAFTAYEHTQCNFIAPADLIVRNIELYYYYNDAAMDDATGTINIRKSKGPDDTSTATVTTVQMALFNFAGSGMNHNTIYYQRAALGKNLSNSELSKKDGITVYVKRLDQSAATIHVHLSLEAEFI